MTIPADLDANDLLTYYYLRPTPALLRTIVDALVGSNRPGTGAYTSLVVWLSAVLNAASERRPSIVATLAETAGEPTQRLIADALAQLDADPAAALSTDALWAMYFATGELGPLTEILAQLDADGSGTVAWSVRANAYQHARVRRFCEDTAARLPSSKLRRALVEVLTRVDARLTSQGPCRAEIQARALFDQHAEDPPTDTLDPAQARELVARLRADADSLPDAEFVRANALRDRAIAVLERLCETEPLARTTLGNVIVERAYSLQPSDPALAAEEFERAQAMFAIVGTPVATRNSIEIGFYRAIALREAGDPRSESVAAAAFEAVDIALQTPGNETLAEAARWARSMLAR